MFEVPEDLSALSDEELSALEAEGIAAFDALPDADSPDLTDDDVDQMERLYNAVSRVREEKASRVEAASSRVERARAAAAAMSTAPGEPESDEEPEEPGSAEDEEEDEEEEKAPQAVAASAKKSIVRTTKRREVPMPRQETGVTITAATEIPHVVAGAPYADMRAVAEAFMARSSAFPQTGHVEGTYMRYGVASINRNYMQRGRHTDHPDWRGKALELADEVANEKNLSGGSLVAAGGWCAPSETLYDLCGGESLDGLVDLPTIGVSRGGIRFTMGPDFGDLYANQGFCLTEAQVIAGTAKTCFEIDCPDFEEVRLDVCGICIKAPILTRVGYPELVERWISGSLVAHEHRMAARTITAIQTLTGAATPVADTLGAASIDVLTSLELAAESLRYRYRTGENESLEVIAPAWLRPIVRADLAARKGADRVSMEEVNQHFTDRRLRVQWVYNYQEGAGGFPGTGTGCVTAPPANVEVLIYRSGTFVKGTVDVISLDTVYDVQDLMTNMYTAVFTEEGILIAQRCPGACRLTIPLCISGATGGDLTGCFGVPATP